MFAYFDMKQRLRDAANRSFHAGAGLAFMLLAMFAIQYEEVIAPEVARVTGVATDIGKRITGLAF